MSVDFRIIDFNYVFQDQTDIFVSSENPDFPKENLKKYTRSKVFRTSSDVGEQSIVFDLKTIEEIDSVLVFFNPISEIKFNDSAEIYLQASATNFWAAPPVNIQLFVDSSYDVMSHFFTTDQTYRYWRIKITDPASVDGFFEIPKVVIGKSLSVSRIPEIGFSFEVNDLSRIQSTPYGHKYFDVYPNIKSLSFNYNALTYDNLSLLSDSFSRVGRVSPVVAVLDSQENMYDKDHFTIYGTYTSQFKSNHLFRHYFKSDIEIGEMI